MILVEIRWKDLRAVTCMLGLLAQMYEYVFVAKAKLQHMYNNVQIKGSPRIYGMQLST